MIVYECIKCKSEFKNRKNSVQDGLNCPACRYPLHPICEADEEKENPNFLVIEMGSKDAVPVVFLNGERVEGLVNASLNWETRTDEVGGFKFQIEHAEKDYPTIRSIGLRQGRYAME